MEAACDHLVFSCAGAPSRGVESLPAGYRCEVWEPSTLHALPHGAPRLRYAAWWVFDRTRIFRNDGYAVVLIWKGDTLAHRLGVFPGWYRFPFMGRDDLQFGDLWTASDQRRRGLAVQALRAAISTRGGSTRRTFWYLTHESNLASIRTAEGAGLRLVGRATRTRRWGLRQLGQFELAALPAR